MICFAGNDPRHLGSNEVADCLGGFQGPFRLVSRELGGSVHGIASFDVKGGQELTCLVQLDKGGILSLAFL